MTPRIQKIHDELPADKQGALLEAWKEAQETTRVIEKGVEMTQHHYDKYLPLVTSQLGFIFFYEAATTSKNGVMAAARINGII